MLRIIAFVTFILISLNLSSQNFDHSKWTELLESHVSDNGIVDYKSIKDNEDALKAYLNQFIKIHPENNWSRSETLAYWINAYNAFTVKLIIDNYPIESIRAIEQPWDKKFIPIDGELLSLNHIEHKILRQMGEPRIHFAINCASVSCPKLLNEAFTADQLEQQLDKVTKAFINSAKNNITKDHIRISKIFKWFAEDFKQSGSLIGFLNDYSDIQISEKAKTSYLEYNWNLNE